MVTLLGPPIMYYFIDHFWGWTQSITTSVMLRSYTLFWYISYASRVSPTNISPTYIALFVATCYLRTKNLISRGIAISQLETNITVSNSAHTGVNTSRVTYLNLTVFPGLYGLIYYSNRLQNATCVLFRRRKGYPH